MCANAAFKGQSGHLDWFNDIDWNVNGISDVYYDFILLLIIMNYTDLWYQVWFISIHFNLRFVDAPLTKCINCFDNQTQLLPIIDNIMSDDTIALLCNKSLNKPTNQSVMNQISEQVSEIKANDESNDNSNNKSTNQLTDNSVTGLKLPEQKQFLMNIFNDMIEKYWGPELNILTG